MDLAGISTAREAAAHAASRGAAPNRRLSRLFLERLLRLRRDAHDDAKKRPRRGVGLCPALFPIAQRGDWDFGQLGKLFLRQFELASGRANNVFGERGHWRVGVLAVFALVAANVAL